ncbi:voltage-dependent calcium channel subunit alpha-2/delta-4 [Manduca sexta]|uniref:voltage-dependent calcium channel subunit alpha-2/delta-4 n=1 Tax=Manduca sexta TaxID=7130 RepID=UPI00188F20DF|nr:voltage-dependent calcium channel subunit alpha-2/delta-4 [Manduca sexta]
MDLVFFTFILFISSIKSLQLKSSPLNKTLAEVKKKLEKHEEVLSEVIKHKTEVVPIKITNVTQVKITPPVAPKKSKSPPKMIPPELIQDWAIRISEKLLDNDRRVVRREEILKGFSDIKIEVRNGTAIVNKMAGDLEELLLKRVKAAENIMRKAEELAKNTKPPPGEYVFDDSVDLDQVKKPDVVPDEAKDTQLPLNCSSLEKVSLKHNPHFDAQVSLDRTSVYVAREVFPCDPRVINHLYWSQGLLSTFQKNYAQDATTEFQYFCSAAGFLRHYPAALWKDMYKLELDTGDVYDCRLRPWYVNAEGAPRDVLILLDASGSMDNSSNQVIAEEFTLALLSALTDDDQVNVLRFNVVIQSPISCFNEKLVPANHVNSAAMMAALKFFPLTNLTDMDSVLRYSVDLLKKQRDTRDRPHSCQQAIVLLTDSMYENFTRLMQYLDPKNDIRLFVLWLHDIYGLRDNTKANADWLSCDRDGYFAELITHSDVTEQVMRILRVLERPLVAQRKERLRVYSDVYAHVEDPRRSEYHWKQKENEEQRFRYDELRKDKHKLLSPPQMYKDYMYQVDFDAKGYYYEGQDINYRLEISVSVPVFDSITVENITKELDEEKKRKSTRTYPVNRLLGVAGIDIPIDHLKLMLPYHQIGAGGSLLIVDHRGNIVLHDNVKPVFDGDILKPGYRTVDFLDLEQPGMSHKPRHYPAEWLEFRKSLVINKEKGKMTLYGKNIFEDGLRATLELREYHWKRVLDHYTAVVVLPQHNRHHAVPEGKFTKEIAEEALKSLSKTEYAVHPDWLYCRHIDPSFDSREAEVLHFIRRRSDEPNFAMQKLKYTFSPFPPTLLKKTYQCNEELMARFCKEVLATDKWAKEHEETNTDRDCSKCELGSTTAFFASESGLTRWQPYHATSTHADPPAGSWWARAPSEPWYRRASALPDTYIVHKPITPVRKLRTSFRNPPPLDTRSQWLTVAKTLGFPDKGIIGVAGYHLHPKHLIDLLSSVTSFPICEEEDEDKCVPRCDNVAWACVLVDEGGWVVARDKPEEEQRSEDEDDVTEHLATLYPTAMGALLNASVFELNWIHDYQGVCFPPKDEKSNFSPTMPSILRSLWHSAQSILRITQELATFLLVLNSAMSVSAETEKKSRNVETVCGAIMSERNMKVCTTTACSSIGRDSLLAIDLGPSTRCSVHQKPWRC